MRHLVSAFIVMIALATAPQLANADSSALPTIKGKILTGDNQRAVSTTYALKGQKMKVQFYNHVEGSPTYNPAKPEASITLTCNGSTKSTKGIPSDMAKDDGHYYTGGWALDINNNQINFDKNSTCQGGKFFYEAGGVKNFDIKAEIDYVKKNCEDNYKSPDYKKYCLWPGTKGDTKQLTGNTGDDMFKIYNDSASKGSFFEYLHASEDLDSKYRLNWVERTTNNGPIAMPSGPFGKDNAFADYKNFINGKRPDGITLKEGCYPIKISLCNNRPPSANDHDWDVLEEYTLKKNIKNDLLKGAKDPDGDALTFTKIVTHPKNGTIVEEVNNKGVKTGHLLYTPKNNFYGTDTFTYEIEDKMGLKATAQATVKVADVGELQANNSSGTTDINLGFSKFVSITRPKNNVHPVNFSIHTQPSNGTASITSDGRYTYRPNTRFVGNDSFTYKINDGHGTTDTATVSVKVLPPKATLKTYHKTITIPRSSWNSASNSFSVNVTPATFFNNPYNLQLRFEDTGTKARSKGTITVSANSLKFATKNLPLTTTDKVNDEFMYKVLDQYDRQISAPVTFVLEDKPPAPTPPAPNPVQQPEKEKKCVKYRRTYHPEDRRSGAQTPSARCVEEAVLNCSNPVTSAWSGYINSPHSSAIKYKEQTVSCPAGSSSPSSGKNCNSEPTAIAKAKCTCQQQADKTPNLSGEAKRQFIQICINGSPVGAP